MCDSVRLLFFFFFLTSNLNVRIAGWKSYVRTTSSRQWYSVEPAV